MNVRPNEREWFPKWVASYAADPRVKPLIQHDDLIPVEREERAGSTLADDASLVPGEGNAGLLKEDEPGSVRRMLEKLRLLHHARSTEEPFFGKLEQFIRHLDDADLERYGKPRRFSDRLGGDSRGRGGQTKAGLERHPVLSEKVGRRGNRAVKVCRSGSF
jgi:hypothetical protein